MTETPEQTKARRVEAFINGLRLSDGKSELAVDVVARSDAEADMVLVARRQVEWQPIRTAPKDDQPIIVKFHDQLSGAPSFAVVFRFGDPPDPRAGWKLDAPFTDEVFPGNWIEGWLPLPTKAPTAVPKCAHCDDTETVTSSDGAEILCPHCTF